MPFLILIGLFAVAVFIIWLISWAFCYITGVRTKNRASDDSYDLPHFDIDQSRDDMIDPVTNLSYGIGNFKDEGLLHKLFPW
jgi:hypothetical protein